MLQKKEWSGWWRSCTVWHGWRC